jgi:hypothetical protein
MRWVAGFCGAGAMPGNRADAPCGEIEIHIRPGVHKEHGKMIYFAGIRENVFRSIETD